MFYFIGQFLILSVVLVLGEGFEPIMSRHVKTVLPYQPTEHKLRCPSELHSSILAAKLPKSEDPDQDLNLGLSKTKSVLLRLITDRSCRGVLRIGVY